MANYGSGSISRHALTDGTLLGSFGAGNLLDGPNYFTVLTTVPEPSATAALFGGAVLLITATRRRRP